MLAPPLLNIHYIDTQHRDGAPNIKLQLHQCNSHLQMRQLDLKAKSAGGAKIPPKLVTIKSILSDGWSVFPQEGILAHCLWGLAPFSNMPVHTQSHDLDKHERLTEANE